MKKQLLTQYPETEHYYVNDFNINAEAMYEYYYGQGSQGRYFGD